MFDTPQEFYNLLAHHFQDQIDLDPRVHQDHPALLGHHQTFGILLDVFHNTFGKTILAGYLETFLTVSLSLTKSLTRFPTTTEFFTHIFQSLVVGWWFASRYSIFLGYLKTFLTVFRRFTKGPTFIQSTTQLLLHITSNFWR